MKPHKYSSDFAMVFCPRWGVNVPWTAPAYLLEAVRSRRFSAKYFDYNIKLYWDNATPELWTDNNQHQFWKKPPSDYLLDQIDVSEIDAAVVGFSLTETNILFSIEIAKRLRRHDPNKVILFGGHRVFFQEDADTQVPLGVCDAIIEGEGELTLIDILENGLNRNLGTYTPGENGWEHNGERVLNKNLDMFPWPRYDDVDWELFPNRHISIMGSRGCIKRCSFCNDVARARYKFRCRSPQHIAQEMFYHRSTLRPRFIVFNDPLLNGNYRSFRELCDILIENKWDIPWAGNFAIRNNMPIDLLPKAKRAHLSTVILGLESGSNNVLKLMKKGATVEDAEKCINNICDSGIKVELNLVVGFPGETEEDFQDTLDFLEKLAPKISQIVSVATLNLDRSYLWDHLDEYNIIKQNKDRHISWSTKDGKNTYEVRCERADRLLNQAVKLGLSHDRLDVDIERKDQLIDIDFIKRRRGSYVFLFFWTSKMKHRLRKALVATHLLGPAKKMRNSLMNSKLVKLVQK